ncbi:MAG: hypothetical protein V3T69_06195 [Acidiferrobacterales bacterium]
MEHKIVYPPQLADVSAYFQVPSFSRRPTVADALPMYYGLFR